MGQLQTGSGKAYASLPPALLQYYYLIIIVSTSTIISSISTFTLITATITTMRTDIANIFHFCYDCD